MNLINVGGAENFSLVDYPGQIAAVVFLQGCPWRCPFCYNADLQKSSLETNFIWEKFVEFLKTRVGRLDAVVFSGGEPLVQDNLAEAIGEVKALGYKIGLHTGGYRPDALSKVLPLVDWVGFDIKAPFEKNKYQAVTKTNHLEKVAESLDLLLQSGKDFECRTTCDPRILKVEDLFSIGQDLAAKGVKKYYLQKYRPIPSDKVTTDSQCEDLISNSQLLEFLQTSFSDFEVRK